MMRYQVRRLILLAALLSGCAGAGSAAPTPSARSASPTTAAPATTAPTLAPTEAPTQAPSPTAAAAADQPAIDQDFPDPDTLAAGGAYYVYATNFGSRNVQVARSQDLRSWQVLGDALPFLPPWASPGFTWAPDVSAAGDGFVLYFTARDAASQRQCIGAASGPSPEGPFTAADQALVCQVDEGGSIDPASFVDSGGERYLLWKNDGNCCGLATWIYIQRTSPDGMRLEGEPTKLITAGQPWEGTLVEAPTLIRHGGRYVLLYSANSYAGADYAVGYATAASPAGPYEKAPRPLLATRPGTPPLIGPGGQDVLTTPDGRTWIVFHAWDADLTYRAVHIEALGWQGGAPSVTIGVGP